ncbi:MAG: hypothetical protein FJ249_05210 [Nitrospira sp.]|nr:hypothetical protein [Nitrospira sp.]
MTALSLRTRTSGAARSETGGPAWAAVLSYALSPLHRHLVCATGERRTLSARLICLLLTIRLILPLVSLSFLIGDELTRAYTAIGGLAERAAKGESLLPDQWRQYPMMVAAIERLDEYERLTGKMFEPTSSRTWRTWESCF